MLTKLKMLTTEAARELYIAGLDRNAAAVDGAQARVGEEVDHVRLCGLLHGEDGARLEAQPFLLRCSELPHQALEGQLAQKQFGTLLVAADVAQGDGAGAELERLLHAAGDRSSCLLGLLLRDDRRAEDFASGGLGGSAAGRLNRAVLRARHLGLKAF